eukprot:5056749-Pleurochrysis_carterae.AAC.4
MHVRSPVVLPCAFACTTCLVPAISAKLCSMDLRRYNKHASTGETNSIRDRAVEPRYWAQAAH